MTGPFRPALEGAFRDALARLRREDPLAPLAVVAPSARLADRLQELALEALPGGFAAVRFFNLFSFARAIYEEAAPPGWRLLLDDLVPSRLLGAVVRRHFARERYLGRAAPAPGPLLAAMHELKAAAVPPDRALEALKEEDLGWDDAPKLAEILSLYKRYSEELRRRKIHVRADVARLAADQAPRSALLGSLRHVLYYGFYDLDQNQLDLLGEVPRRVPCTVFFPFRDDPAFDYARGLLQERLAPLAQEVRRLPDPPPAPRLSQVAASGAHDEVWAAAKEALRLADEGVPYGQIAVVARTLDPYADLVASVFREHRIPWTSSARRPLARDPAVKAARLLFSLDDFDRAHVLDLLRSPFFRRAGGDPALWDQASRLLGIGHGADAWRSRLGALSGRDFSLEQGGRGARKTFLLPRAEVDAFWGHVRELLEAPPAPAGWRDFAAWALARYRRFLEPDPRVERAIGSLGELEGLALDDPGGALLETLVGLREPAGGPAGVQVLDAMAARGLSFRALILLGMNERVFPRFILEDAFLRDAVRSRIEHRLGSRFPRKVDGYAEERLLFELLLGSADEVVLCHQRSDEKGRLQIRSAFLPPGEPRQVKRRPAERLASVPFERLTPREAALRTGQAEAAARAFGRDVSRLVRAAEFLEAVESRGKPTPFDGRVDAREYWNALAGFGMSPTAVEKLAECPFRYFASRMLDLEELEEPESEDEIAPVEIGSLYHEVLEGFHRNGDLEREIEAGFRRFEEKRSVRYPVLWEVEKERIRNVLRAFVDADDLSVYRPADFEVELKGELPVSVAGRSTVAFRGYADRLDLGPEGAFRVVDYKRRRSGKFRWIMETGILSKGAYLQPPLYVLLAALKLGQKDLSRSRFSYSFIEDALDEGKWELALDGEFWERRAEFDALLARILETIPRGEFLIRPGEACAWCEFRTMCRKQHLPTRLRAGGGAADE